jgi:membrane associated rhomboid family serine protease
MKKQLILAAKITGIVCLICLGTSVLYWISVALNLGGLSYLLFYNPFVSALVHADFSHLAYNMVMLFLCLIPVIHQEFEPKKIIRVATILSCLFFPFILFQISLPVIGLSMFTYFLLSRVVLSRKKYFWVYLSLFVIMLIGEATLIQSDDGTAHLAHFFGASMGALSTRYFPRLFRTSTFQQLAIQTATETEIVDSLEVEAIEVVDYVDTVQNEDDALSED